VRLAHQIAAVVGITPGETLTDYFAVMYRHPALYRSQMETGIMLLGSSAIPPRKREIAILRSAWLCGAPYEWGAHVRMARSLGVSSEEIERITLGSTAPGWTRAEAALLRAVEELHADHMIADATWAELAGEWSEAQLIELPALVGQYIAVALIQNSLRLPLDPGCKGLDER
jgi:alkylhydroperoxidase family enzyme